MHFTLTRAALCRGLLRSGQFTGSVSIANVTFFLDDPGDPPPRRCGQPGRCG
ncbi:MAG: hypothetical protein KF718_08865 [Polyangiaceae bacterium]|nr:hypothetical protein [Polyangiaceae bacterium]